jgi:hypothetical protein
MSTVTGSPTFRRVYCLHIYGLTVQKEILLDRLFQNLEPFLTSFHFGTEMLDLHGRLLKHTYGFNY